MRIIENHNDIKVDCNSCNSTLGVVESDITFHEIPHRTSSFTATCGACGHTINIPKRTIPQLWIGRIVPPYA